MNYVTLVRKILDLAVHHDGIRMAIDQDIYEINNMQDARYPIFAAVPTEPQIERENYMEYHLTFYYIDRLKSENNRYSDAETALIHSAGIQCLSSILRSIRMMDGVLDVTQEVQYVCWTDTEIFSDRCNGVYANVTIRCPKDSIC